MTSKLIRKKFLDYFSANNHTVVPSSSLVPEKDPTLLFVNAGMVQFKNIFLGNEKREYARATTCQKCVRAGGKHNDLENIGKTLRHHTFFEMLGNFSFGDYFKKEAIAYAWDFLRNSLALDEKKMWVTIFRDDDEAHAIWKSVGVADDRIVRLGEKDNFWSMGDEGPCGPCSEIIYDLGAGVGCGRPTCAVGCDCDRYLEIWNLVFMESERTKGGQMKRLPNPSIDTGMGLERVTSILEGKIGNYETDLFMPILRGLEDISPAIYGEDSKTDAAMRVIADHARGATFIINDGVLPSKEGRGYVLRRIIRRALRYGRKIGIEKEFLYGLSKIVVDIMEDVYPDIKNNHPYIVQVLKGEEERFNETLNMGMRLFEEYTDTVKKDKATVIPGELAYKLYDTYGFPIDITQEMAEENELSIDMDGFEKALDEQRERSRTTSRLKGEGWTEGHRAVLRETSGNLFVGYEKLDAEGTVTTVLKDQQVVDELRDGEEGELFFDYTPFYAESGGQVGDRGRIEGPSGTADVRDVIKVKDDLFSHAVRVTKGVVRRGDRVHLVVDIDYRKDVARNHTATHLLQFALRTVLGDHVKQSGSLVENDRLRFDFTHFQGLKDVEIKSVEDIVNEKILGCHEVITDVKSRDQAIREGATALFEEKYGEQVRVVQIAGFSTELCGGTHVRNTGQIGSFYIVHESSLASGVRRIEAVTGRGAILDKRKSDSIIQSIAKFVNTDIDRVTDRIQAIIAESHERQKEIERLKGRITAQKIEEAIGKAEKIDGAQCVSMFISEAGADELRKVTDIIRSRIQSCIILVGTRQEDKGMLIVAVTKDIQSTYNAGKMIKRLTEKYGGKGGGSPQIAQGGIPADRVVDALRDTACLTGL